MARESSTLQYEAALKKLRKNYKEPTGKSTGGSKDTLFSKRKVVSNEMEDFQQTAFNAIKEDNDYMIQLLKEGKDKDVN